MPCKCDYMEPNRRELESKVVLNLLHEVGLEESKIGYYGRVKTVDEDTRKLCKFCQENDVTNYSLELQIWWRDHKEMDKKRREMEESKVKQEIIKQSALSKLTEEEKEALGLIQGETK